MKRARRAERGTRGFTLLEVLAAVAIFAIWFTVLAESVISGVAREGRSQRRIEASLLADRVVADFESQMLLGAAPKLEDSAYSDDLFEVHFEQSPFDLAASVTPVGTDGAPLPEGLDLAALAEGGGRAAKTPILLQVRVDVTWLENFDEWTVSRTTYALDTAALAALEGLEQAAGAAAAEDEVEDADGGASEERDR